METLIIFGASILIIVILLNMSVNNRATTSNVVRITQARNTVNEITSTAEEVWSQGPGASAKVIVTIPQGINESESGILNNKTIRFRVFTRDGFTDVSEVSTINIIGEIPKVFGEYELILTSYQDHVLISYIKQIIVTTDKDTYFQGETVYYYISTLDEIDQPRTSNVTIQLLDTNGTIRAEHNKTTIGGLTNDSFVLPYINDPGYWRIYAYDNETIGFKAILVMASVSDDLSITQCNANDTNLVIGESSRLRCKVKTKNPYLIDTVLYSVNGTNFEAFNPQANFWDVHMNCTSTVTWNWTTAWANDTGGNITSTTSNGLPIIIFCTDPGNVTYIGCDANSTKATYCGWKLSNETMCNDCSSFYEDAPFTECSYTSGLTYCDEGCGATCDEASDYDFNNPGDQCSYGCNNTCDYDNVDVCGDPGDLYGNDCFYGTNGCDDTGCTTSSEECPTWCIDDFDGGSCGTTTRTDPSTSNNCYYNRACLTSGCNLSSVDTLNIDYCDYCGSSGIITGDYSPTLNSTCSSSCPNSGTRYWDETVTRSDDCSSGTTQVNTEIYQIGYIYTSQTSLGSCDNTECALDCGGTGSCVASTCQCATLVNITVFDEDFNPKPYYDYNWSRQGSDWDSKDNSRCHSSGGCAHADGNCDESNDWIQTDSGLINLSGANEVYVDFWVREDTSFDAGDWFRVWCYDSSVWVNIYEEDAGDWVSGGTQRHRYTLVDSDCWISDARFRITIIANQNGEDVFVDDFRVIKEVFQ